MAAQLTLMNGALARGLWRYKRAGHEFLAGAAFARDEHGGLRVGDLADQLRADCSMAGLLPSIS